MARVADHSAYIRRTSCPLYFQVTVQAGALKPSAPGTQRLMKTVVMTDTPLEKVVLGEIEGKNRAIHLYDDIAWKIRSGFLTLMFAGWAIVLKGIVEAQSSMDKYRGLVFALLLFSAAFGLGAWYIDRNYLRRKFRVILALNELIDELAASGGDYSKVSSRHLKVAGDDAQRPFDCAGYREARSTELAVYLAPLLILIAGVFLVIS